MDGTRFDDIARALTANRTRRQAVKDAVALALGGTVRWLAAPAAVAASRAVVRCRYDDETKTLFDISGRHAQTFKATQTGKLSEVKVWISHILDPATNRVGDYVARIARVNEAGVPDDAMPLAEKVIADDDLMPGEHPITFSFGVPHRRCGKASATPSSSAGLAAGLTRLTGRLRVATHVRAPSCTRTRPQRAARLTRLTQSTWSSRPSSSTARSQRGLGRFAPAASEWRHCAAP